MVFLSEICHSRNFRSGCDEQEFFFLPFFIDLSRGISWQYKYGYSSQKGWKKQNLLASFSFDYLLVIYRFEEGRPNELSLRGLRREWRVLCSIFVVRSMGCLLRPTPLTSRCVRDFNHNKLQYNLSDPRSPRQSSLNSFPSINALKHYDLSFFWFDIISLVIKDFLLNGKR